MVAVASFHYKEGVFALYYVYARRRDDSSPCGFEKLETQRRSEAYSRAREWHAEGYIVRVFQRNEYGLFDAVPPERWRNGGEGRQWSN